MLEAWDRQSYNMPNSFDQNLHSLILHPDSSTRPRSHFDIRI